MRIPSPTATTRKGKKLRVLTVSNTNLSIEIVLQHYYEALGLIVNLQSILRSMDIYPNSPSSTRTTLYELSKIMVW